MKFMLDTNICIFIINKHPAKVLKKLCSLQPKDVCLSSTTVSELRYGVAKSQHQQQNHAALNEFILPFNIVNYDEEAALHYGDIRAQLEKNGKLIGPLDMLIAAHAKSLNVTLVSNNTKEFERVPGLKVNDWVHGA